jgi:hypothetical protein
VVKDATADYPDAELHAALDINLPNYAGAIMTTDEIVGLLSAVQTSASPHGNRAIQGLSANWLLAVRLWSYDPADYNSSGTSNVSRI